jgi:hypothetical protein
MKKTLTEAFLALLITLAAIGIYLTVKSLVNTKKELNKVKTELNYYA